MKVEKKEYGSLCFDGKLMKTVYIELIPEDDEDIRIIQKHGNGIYLM